MIDTATDTTVQDLVEEAEKAPYHTILEIWQKVLAPASKEIDGRISPQWSTRIIGEYPEMSFAEMPLFRDRYYAKVLELAEILNDTIEEDRACLDPTSAEEDVETNTHRYLDLLFAWQLRLLSWELAWRPDQMHAAAELASLGEVLKMFFGEQGLTALLDQIGFQFTDEHRELLTETLEQARKDAEEK